MSARSKEFLKRSGYVMAGRAKDEEELPNLSLYILQRGSQWVQDLQFYASLPQVTGCPWVFNSVDVPSIGWPTLAAAN